MARCEKRAHWLPSNFSPLEAAEDWDRGCKHRAFSLQIPAIVAAAFFNRSVCFLCQVLFDALALDSTSLKRAPIKARCEGSQERGVAGRTG